MVAKPRVVYPDANEGSIEMLRENGLIDRLNSVADFDFHLGIPPTPEDFLAVVGDADIVLLGGNIFDDVLHRSPRLKLVSFSGMGAANFVNLSLARDRGIDVAVTPDYGDISVSEHAVALLFAVSRRLVEGDRHVREHRWRPFTPGVQLAGKTAGVIGYGRIGARTAWLLHGLGMTVLAWARNPPEKPVSGVEFVELDDLLQEADVVTLHLALTDETIGFVTEAMLDRLKQGAIFINTARAELVRPGAIESRLKAGELAAGIDVFVSEPPAIDDPLLTLSNVVLSPHQGYNTPEGSASMWTIAVENIENYTMGLSFHRAQ